MTQEVVDLVVTRSARESEGTVRWEDWWVRRHGHVRSSVPTFSEYLSFIDFDLAHNGLPRLSRDGEGIVVRRVPRNRVADVRRVVEYHGFNVAPLV